MPDPTLVLRDIQQPPAPPWWPPAPGWWVLLALVLALLAIWGYQRQIRARRRRAILAIFDEAVAQAGSPPAQIAAMSELLRRAARRRDASAATLQGETWLAFLDAGDARAPFSGGVGRLLLEGGFRRNADPRQVAELRALVRARFQEWMAQGWMAQGWMVQGWMVK